MSITDEELDKIEAEVIAMWADGLCEEMTLPAHQIIALMRRERERTTKRVLASVSSAAERTSKRLGGPAAAAMSYFSSEVLRDEECEPPSS